MKRNKLYIWLLIFSVFIVLFPIVYVTAGPPPDGGGPPPPPEAGLEHGQSLVFLIALFLMMGYGLYHTVIAGKIPQIRKLAPMEAIDEGIGIAVETGKKVHMGLTHIVLSSEYAAYSLAGVAIAGIFARKAAKAGVPAWYTIDSMPAYTVYEGVVHDAYAAEGKLDDFNNPDMVQVRVLTGAYDLAVASLLQRENVGHSVISGEIGKVVLQLGEAHRVANVFSILGAPLIDKLEWGISTFDYVLMLSETYAAGAWATGDPTQLGTLVGTDIITWVSAALAVILTIVATAIGNLNFLTG